MSKCRAKKMLPNAHDGFLGSNIKAAKLNGDIQGHQFQGDSL